MRCAKCGHKIRGATWYCPSCGTPVDDLNVADSVYAVGRSRLWVRILSAAVALFALAGVVFLTGRVLQVVDLARRAARPTASAALPAAPAYATVNGPIETLVAAGERSAGRYPDGAVDAPPEVATAVPSGVPSALTTRTPAAAPTPLDAPNTAAPSAASPPPHDPLPSRRAPLDDPAHRQHAADGRLAGRLADHAAARRCRRLRA